VHDLGIWVPSSEAIRRLMGHVTHKRRGGYNIRSSVLYDGECYLGVDHEKRGQLEILVE